MTSENGIFFFKVVFKRKRNCVIVEMGSYELVGVIIRSSMFTHTHAHTDRHTRAHTQTDTHVHTERHTLAASISWFELKSKIKPSQASSRPSGGLSDWLPPTAPGPELQGGIWGHAESSLLKVCAVSYLEMLF